MDAKTLTPLDQMVKEFMALPDHAARCDYFRDHPELARIYRAAHFQKAEQSGDGQVG